MPFGLSPSPADVVVIEGARTPIGTFLGGLKRVSATQLGTAASKGALERSGIDPAEVDQVVFGNVLQSSKDAAYLARHISLDAGVPTESPALAVNRACGSGLEAVIQAAKALALGESRVVLAGGSENMSMMPYAMRGVRDGWKMVKADVDDMLFSALHDPKAGCAIGETVEHLAEVCGVTREQADAAAVEGQRRAAAAREAGVFAEEIVAVDVPARRGKVTTVSHDEAPRPETSLEILAKLPGLFGRGGVVTAGNSCGLNDAAAAVVMATRARARDLGARPLGRVVSWGVAGVEPLRMGLGPVPASLQALKRAGLTLADMDVVELNDSFTVQAVALEAAFAEHGEGFRLDPERVNPNGGAVALGHPMGATGTRLVLSALYQLRRTGGRYALCTVCVGGGQGVAVVVESLVG